MVRPLTAALAACLLLASPSWACDLIVLPEPERADVIPVDNRAANRVEPEQNEVISSEHFLWIGIARVSMYTCVELGGCNRTALGLSPYEGVVAVDPRVIPLGSMVWVEGLGIFLAADTGSLVRGNRIDVYVDDYTRAVHWGVQYLSAAAYVDP
jgi:3D (Asp-Asp-Asp) domain-containing protein